MGDFYELLFDDAKVCSKILGLTLISRDRLKNGVDSVAMAGFPYHQLEGYIAKLLHAGKKVAVVESEVS